ncbi:MULTISPECIES: hypothetical protein [unclassified Microbacterium]
MSDTNDPQHNTQGEPDDQTEADTASGGAADEPDLTTDENGAPKDNPSGG